MGTKVKMNIDYATKKKLNKELEKLSENQEKKDRVENFYVNMLCGLKKKGTKKSIKQQYREIRKVGV